MEEQIKRKSGRPPNVIKELTDITERTLPPVKQELAETATKRKVGTFIVVNSPTIKGIRLNLEKVRTYAKAGSTDDSVQIAWDNGTSSVYQFGSSEAAYKFLELLDGHCL